MTRETFDKAIELRDRIVHIDSIVSMLDVQCDNFKLTPPTRHSGFYISYHDVSHRTLSEAEVKLIRDALVGEKARLIDELERL